MRALSVHLTDMCNSACAFCVVGAPLRQVDSVDLGVVEAFLRRHQGEGYGVVNLHGGEPTVHPKILDVLELIAELGYEEVHIQTNGMALANVSLAGALARRKVTRVIVSLHGSSAKVHETLSLTPGGWNRTVAGIENAAHEGMAVRTNTVITTNNVHDLAEIARLAGHLGVAHVNYSNMHPVGSARLSSGRLMVRLATALPRLEDACRVALDGGLGLTLEGFPRCVLNASLQAYRLENVRRDIRLLIQGEEIRSYDAFMQAQMRRPGHPCQECEAAARCGGVYPEYVAQYGWGEFRAVRSSGPRRKEGLRASSHSSPNAVREPV